MYKKNILLFLFMFTILLCGCNDVMISNEKHIKVDGILLEHHRVIHLSAKTVKSMLNIEISHGDITLDAGKTVDLAIDVWERYENDIRLEFTGSDIKGISKTNSPYALGKIFGTIPSNISVSITSGAGSVSVTNVSGKILSVESGAGNITSTNNNFEKIVVESGAGMIAISNQHAHLADFSTGAGNVTVEKSRFSTINISTGAGNIHAIEVEADNTDFETGIGNITILDCQFDEKDFSTGLGKIRVNQSLQ